MEEKSFKLVKKIELTKNGFKEYWYSRDPKGNMVTSSLSYSEGTAREFFDRVVELNGETSKEEIILEVPVN